jgi:AraC family transcriptional regulator
LIGQTGRFGVGSGERGKEESCRDMTRKDAPLPLFPKNAPAIVVGTLSSALSVSRLTVDVAAGEQVDLTMPAEDAFVVLYQLRDHSAHEFRLDGKVQQIGAAPKATLNVVDMTGEPRGRLTQPVDTLFFHLPRAALDEIASEAGAAKIGRLVAPAPWLTTDLVVDGLHRPLIDALGKGSTANRLFHDHLLNALGAHFASTYGGMEPYRLDRGGLAPWQERRAKELLAANLAGEISLGQIALECGLSVTYFSRAFKRSIGVTPHGWLQNRRIERASLLLRDRGLPLADIALLCGFADQSHFTRTFARLVGTSPGAWRRLQ